MQQDFIVFLGYALGSLDETQSHLCAAYDRKYLTKEQFGGFWSEGIEIRKMIVGFIRSMILPGGGARTRVKPKSWTNQGPPLFVEKVDEDEVKIPPRDDRPPT
jgi:hypothetical protein